MKNFRNKKVRTELFDYAQLFLNVVFENLQHIN